MDEIEVINVLKQYSDEKTGSDKIRAAILSYLAHSLSGLNYMCKAKYKTLGNE